MQLIALDSLLDANEAKLSPTFLASRHHKHTRGASPCHNSASLCTNKAFFLCASLSISYFRLCGLWAVPFLLDFGLCRTFSLNFVDSWQLNFLLFSFFFFFSIRSFTFQRKSWNFSYAFFKHLIKMIKWNMI